MGKIITANSVWSKKLGIIKCRGQCLGTSGWLPVSHVVGPDSPPSQLIGLISKFSEFCNINSYKIADSDQCICYINIINANSLTIF